MSGRAASLLVAVPAYNEAATVAAVVGGIMQALPDAHVLVVDDGSDDETAAAAAGAGARVIVLPFNIGVGGAMRAAFVYADRNGYDAVVQVDADGQHDPAQLPELVAALADASVVIGSRFAGAGGYRASGPRRWAMIMLARGLSRIAGTRLTDTTSGFRASDRRAVALFARRYPTEYLGDTVESVAIAARAGLRIVEIPVTMLPRAGGRPSQGPIRATLYLGRAVLALYVAVFGRRASAADS